MSVKSNHPSLGWGEWTLKEWLIDLRVGKKPVSSESISKGAVIWTQAVWCSVLSCRAAQRVWVFLWEAAEAEAWITQVLPDVIGSLRQRLGKSRPPGWARVVSTIVVELAALTRTAPLPALAGSLGCFCRITGWDIQPRTTVPACGSSVQASASFSSLISSCLSPGVARSLQGPCHTWSGTRFRVFPFSTASHEAEIVRLLGNIWWGQRKEGACLLSYC